MPIALHLNGHEKSRQREKYENPECAKKYQRPMRPRYRLCIHSDKTRNDKDKKLKPRQHASTEAELLSIQNTPTIIIASGKF